MKNLLGAHVSISGGIEKSIERANSIEIDCMQIFTKSNRAWNSNPLSEECILKFKKALDNSNIKQAIVHASYLINLASDNKETEIKSTNALIDEISRCEKLGINNLILHPGNSGKQSTLSGIEKIAKNINIALSASSSCSILLENMAGQGSSIAHSFENIANILDLVKYEDRVGVCFDTCHAFAAGYDLKNNYEDIWNEFDKIIGLKKLQAIHLNDSKKPLGSKVDRHENIGIGHLTNATFEKIINDKRFFNLPKILETPILIDEQDYKIDLKTLKSLIYI